MSCEFYWISGSPFSWRVHLALEFKGLAYQSRLLNASDGEHETPEFLALNPRGKVPVLRDGAAVIYESVAILSYLEAKYERPRLFGADALETGTIWQRVHEVENYARNPLLKMAIAIIGNEFADNPDETGELTGECARQLNWIEDVLSGSEWLAGGTLSAADFVFYPVLKIFLRAAKKKNARALDLGVVPFEKRSPATARWAAGIEALPGYERTYPPHWRE